MLAGRGMVGQIVVVFYRLQRGLLTEKAKVMNWDRGGEERGQGRDHREAGPEDGDKGNAGGGGGGGCSWVFVTERGLVLIGVLADVLAGVSAGVSAGVLVNVGHTR